MLSEGKETTHKKDVPVFRHKNRKKTLVGSIESEKDKIEKILKELKINELNPELQTRLRKLVKRTTDVFVLPDDPLSATDLVEQKIELTDNEPVYTRQYILYHKLCKEC